MLASRQMRRLLETDARTFIPAAIELVKKPGASAGVDYLLTLLVTNNLIVDRLADPNQMDIESAVRLARRISNTTDSFLDVKLVRMLLPTNGAPPQVTDENARLRVLELVSAISTGGRTITLLTQLSQCPDPKVQSKVALLVGRINRNLKWAEQQMKEQDPRLRANALEALWGLDTETARAVFSRRPDGRRQQGDRKCRHRAVSRRGPHRR